LHIAGYSRCGELAPEYTLEVWRSGFAPCASGQPKFDFADERHYAIYALCFRFRMLIRNTNTHPNETTTLVCITARSRFAGEAGARRELGYVYTLVVEPVLTQCRGAHQSVDKGDAMIDYGAPSPFSRC
jgi:hypothetical protein